LNGRRRRAVGLSSTETGSALTQHPREVYQRRSNSENPMARKTARKKTATRTARTARKPRPQPGKKVATRAAGKKPAKRIAAKKIGIKKKTATVRSKAARRTAVKAKVAVKTPQRSAARTKPSTAAGAATAAAALLDDLVGRARRVGADAADAVLVESAAISVAQRLGKPEKLERAESRDLGLRVFVGKRQAIVSTTDTTPAMLAELVERAVAMARTVPDDPYCGLAAPDELSRRDPTIDLSDPIEPAMDVLTERARSVEGAALAVSGVTNSEGAEAGWSRSTISLVASNGFHGTYRRSHHSVGVSVLAGEGTAMERDYEHASAVYGSDLEDAAAVGKRAGEKAVRRLHPRKAATAKVPILFDPRISRSLLGHLGSAINGAAIARGTSFLKDKLGRRIFAADVTIIDDPHRPRGLNSKPFDGEGIANCKRAIVENGVLTTWVLDLRSARQLGLKSTGHAARGTSSPPSPSLTNLYMTAGKMPPKDMIGGVISGFYVTELMGMGVNGVTGDYSRGAAGFWVDHGELAYPVSEVTIAGNLNDMFLNLTPANDLKFRYGTDAPTIRIDGMTVAGV
jgi:PmbA protein